MAGLYADVPGHRFAYDLDGTYVSMDPINGGAYTAIDAGLLNDESTDGVATFGFRQSGNRRIAFAFPELRDITGAYVYYTGNIGTTRFDYSTNTTDGSDGTWTTGPSIGGGWSGRLYPESRSSIFPISSINGIKGLRLYVTIDGDYQSQTLYSVHIYGLISPTQSLERLEWWDPTLNQQVNKAALDFGDVAQGVVSTKQVRLKNLSPTKTAGTVTISADNSAGGETLLATGMTFSADNTTYSNTITIASIAPSAISPIIYVRRTVGAAEPASIRFARIQAAPGTFA